MKQISAINLSSRCHHAWRLCCCGSARIWDTMSWLEDYFGFYVPQQHDCGSWPSHPTLTCSHGLMSCVALCSSPTRLPCTAAATLVQVPYRKIWQINLSGARNTGVGSCIPVQKTNISLFHNFFASVKPSVKERNVSFVSTEQVPTLN